MKTSIRYYLATALGMTLLALLPVRASAQTGAWCLAETGDWDKNNTKDLLVRGGSDMHLVTIDLYPDRAEITGCGPKKVFTEDFTTINIAKLPRITVNVMGVWVGIHRNIMVQLVMWRAPNYYVFGGTGTMKDSSLLINLEAGSGQDNVTMSLPTLDHSYFDAYVGLAVAQDTFTLNADNAIANGSAARVTALLGNGKNQTVTFNQTGLIDGTLDVNFETGSDPEIAQLTLAGPIGSNGRLFITGDLGNGGDTLDGIVDFSRFSVAAGGEVHLDIDGNYGLDSLKLSRRGTVAGPGNVMAGLFEVRLNGGDGNDTLAVDLGGGGFAAIDGTLRFRLEGGWAADTVSATVDVAAASTTPDLDVFLYGDQGIDQLTCAINDQGPREPVNYGPGRVAIVDGGTDSDTCVLSGNGIVHKRFCEH